MALNIVVLGCGTVGTSIADVLCQHRHNVTVIDQDSDKTQKVNERLDVRTLTGNASQSSVLFQAGVPSCDLCLAVTGSDEVNLIAASMAKAMGAGRTIARVYAPVYRDLSTFDYHRHFHVDRLLSLEHLSAMELAHGIRHGGTVAMESFARGKLEVDEFEISPNAAAVDKLIKELGLPTGIRIACVSREGQTTLALADEQLRVGDRVTLIGTAEAIEELKGMFQTGTTPRRDVVIAGGGETGYHLALALQHGRFGVVLMERDIERCEYLAAKLERTTVVNSDATYRDQLEEERVGTADVFVATTGDDEENIMACVTAREIGAKQILSIVSRPDYAEVVGKLGIDQAVSPREVVARQVLGLLHKGAVISRSSLGAGGLNVFEIEVREGAPITEHVLANVRLPAKCLIAVVVQEDFVRVPGADDRLHAGDTVIALIDDSAVAESLQMFSTNGS